MIKKLGILIFLCPIFILVGVIAVRKARPVPASPPGAKPATEVNPEYKRLISEWSASNYIPLEGNLKEDGRVVEAIDFVRRDVDLTGQQEAQLRQSIRNLLLAFHRGTFEDYLAFRVPIPDFSYNTRVIDKLQADIKNHYSKKGDSTRNKPDEIIRIYWQRCFGGNAFSNYWRGISTDNSHVLVERSKSLPQKLALYALSVGNAGVVSPAPTFIFDVTPEGILKKDGELVSATVSLMVKTEPPEPPHPIHCRFYWVSSCSKWLPMELVSSYVGPRQVDLLF